MKPKIIMVFMEFSHNYSIHTYYKEAFFDIFKHFGIMIYCFIQGEYTNLLPLNTKYHQFGICFETFSDISDLKEKTFHYEIVEMTTFTEGLIPLLLNVRKNFGFPYTEKWELFRNKRLQRELLYHYDKNITVSYKEYSNINEINIEELEKEFCYPFMIKPISWVQSQLVYKIENRNDFEEAKKWFKNANKEHYYALNKITWDIGVLIEEYIDGEMYSLNYYVDENQNIFQTKIVKVLSWHQLWVNDFFNYVRLSWPYIEQELAEYDMDNFVKKNILATWIKSTFVFHEFKKTTIGLLKTIELNGRIGWYRLEMMQEGYKFNLLRCLLWEKMKDECVNINLWFFVFYAQKKGILQGFNMDLIEQIQKYPSYMSKNLISENIWKTTGLTSEGFTKNMILKIKNENEKQFIEDYTFIEKNYFHFLLIE